MKKKMITDPMGQWKHPGKNTRIPSDKITMKGVNYPVLGVSNNGHEKMMYPGQEYIFPGADYVDEFPQMKKGGRTRGLIPMPKPSKKGLASKKYSRSLEATNRLFTENKLFEKPKSRKNKVFDPKAKYYQTGGITQLTPEENVQFQSFYNSLPENLQTDDSTYDIRGYWDALGRPEQFDYSQPTESDNYYHAFSINPNTGEYLKSPAHDTFQHAVDEDRKIGYRPLTNVYGRNIAIENESIADPEEQSFLTDFSGPANYMDVELDDNEIQQYVKGGYVVEDISVPSLTKAQRGGDTKPGIQNVPETTIYDPAGKKVQATLFQKLKDAKDAYQNFTKKHRGKKYRLNEADSASSIEQLRKGIQLYKDEFAKEQEQTKHELKKLENLKSKAALKDNKDIQNLTLKDLNTVKGKMKIENAIRNSDLDSGTVAAIYTGFRLDEVDPNVKSGTGPNKVYSATEAEANAMKNVPEFVNTISNVATAIPLAGAAGALSGTVAPIANAAGKLIFNPVTQGILAAPTIAKMATHPLDTMTGIATTGVELYDKAMGDEDDVNRFGNPYWQDMDDLVNTAALLPGIGSIKAAREFLKTRKGFNFAKNYVKPVKDIYKKGVKTYQKTTAPFLNTNVPGIAAGVADSIIGGRAATEVVNKAGQLITNVPEWAIPTVGNTLKGIGYTTAGYTGVQGASNIQKGLSEGNKEKFDEGIAKTVDAATTLATLTPAKEVGAATQPLLVLTTANEIKDNIDKNETAATAFNSARIINQIAGLPTSTNQVLPRQSVKAFRRLKHKHIRKNLKQKGGIVSELSQKEIDDLIAQGYTVEEVD